MMRTQLQLEDHQVEALKRLAKDRGVSMAELIRRAVDLYLEREDETARRAEQALAVIGRFASGRHDVAEEHDRYLAEHGERV